MVSDTNKPFDLTAAEPQPGLEWLSIQQEWQHVPCPSWSSAHAGYETHGDPSSWPSQY